MVEIPRYESSRNYPSARLAGFRVLSLDKVTVIGMTTDQAVALLTRHSPQSNFKVRPAKVALGQTWQSLTGRHLSEDEIEKAGEIGSLIITGKSAAHSIELAVSNYTALRNGSMSMVLIDWE